MVWEEWAESEGREVSEELEEPPRARTSVSVGMVAEAEKAPMGFPLEAEGADLLLGLLMPLVPRPRFCRTLSQSDLAELVARARRALNRPDRQG